MNYDGWLHVSTIIKTVGRNSGTARHHVVLERAWACSSPAAPGLGSSNHCGPPSVTTWRAAGFSQECMAWEEVGQGVPRPLGTHGASAPMFPAQRSLLALLPTTPSFLHDVHCLVNCVISACWFMSFLSTSPPDHPPTRAKATSFSLSTVFAASGRWSELASEARTDSHRWAGGPTILEAGCGQGWCHRDFSP